MPSYITQNVAALGNEPAIADNKPRYRPLSCRGLAVAALRDWSTLLMRHGMAVRCGTTTGPEPTPGMSHVFIVSNGNRTASTATPEMPPATKLTVCSNAGQ